MNFCNPVSSFLKIKSIKKLIRTLVISFLLSLVLFFFLSALFPRTWVVLDDIRLFFQKHIITTIAEFRYRSVVGQKVELSDLLSKKRLAPGDLLFTAEEATLGSNFITGKWKHTLIYLGTLKQIKLLLGTSSPRYQTIKKLNPDKENKRILESSFEGVQLKALSDLKDSEALLALRVELPKKKIASWVESLYVHLGKPYDFDFDMEDQSSLYCSELLYPLLQQRGFSPQIEPGNFRDVVTPDALVAALLDPQLPKHLVHPLFYIDANYFWNIYNSL